jgi:uncharacterized protein (TIGR02391 family)
LAAARRIAARRFAKSELGTECHCPYEGGMEKLYSLLPTAESLLQVHPQDLAPILLRLGAAEHQNGMFLPQVVAQVTVGLGMTAEYQHAYPHHKQAQVDALLNETWEILRRDGMILPAPDINGQHGWMVLSCDGEAALAAPDGFDRIRALRSFPKSLLHPSIADKVYAALQRGDFPAAVRDAFTEVEISVRAAGGYTDNDYGTDLMRKAFNSANGPLTDHALPEAERKGFEHLFAGAIGAMKNPHSHRKVTIDALQVAMGQVLLASHLLRIVDAAKARLPAASASGPLAAGP